MSRPLKVWGGLTPGENNRFVRTIIATATKKEAAKKLEMPLCHFNNYWCQTGNDIEIRAALLHPGKVLKASSIMGKDFIQED